MFTLRAEYTTLRVLVAKKFVFYEVQMENFWYAAHIVMLVQFKDLEQKIFPVWENVILIEATSVDDAYTKAEERAQMDEGDSDGNFTWGGQPAIWVYAGIRKLVACVDTKHRPADGTEITYSEFIIYGKGEFDKFVGGKEAKLTISAEYPDDEIGNE